MRSSPIANAPGSPTEPKRHRQPYRDEQALVGVTPGGRKPDHHHQDDPETGDHRDDGAEQRDPVRPEPGKQGRDAHAAPPFEGSSLDSCRGTRPAMDALPSPRLL